MPVLPIAGVSAKHAKPEVRVSTANAIFDRVMLVCSAWFVGGVYLDGRAHVHLKVETFYTPWHVVLYSGFGAASVAALPMTSAPNTLPSRLRL